MIDLFARPLGALLKLIYDFISTIGLDLKYLSAYAIAIIVSTIVLKFILLPLTLKQTRSMKKMQDLQPKIQELQKKYKNDQQTLQMKTMELYKEHNVNPFSGCFPILIQFPIIIGFFNVLRDPVRYMFGSEEIYQGINKTFFWIADLGELPGISIGQLLNPQILIASLPLLILPLLAGLTTYFQSKMMNTNSTNTQAQSTQSFMTYFFPIMIFWFSLNFPHGLTLYWVISNLFQIAQQYLTNRSLSRVKEESN